MTSAQARGESDTARMAIADDRAAAGLVGPSGQGSAGRARECRAIDRLLDGGRAGASGALVIHGDPGAGKSELLRYACTHSGDMRVLHVTAARSESGLPFAGLHQLVGPLLAAWTACRDLSGPALSRAFGLAEGPADNPLLIVLGALRLLAGAAAGGGLLAAVDDAHWLDDASMAALASVARRLDDEGVVLLVAGRRDLHAADLDDLPRLALPAGDPRRAWDRANAATRPDEALAADLERIADDATARGAHVVASDALERAAGLSPDAWTRARRRLAAARASWRAGQMDRALALLDGEDVRDGGEHAASIAPAARCVRAGARRPARCARRVSRGGAPSGRPPHDRRAPGMCCGGSVLVGQARLDRRRPAGDRRASLPGRPPPAGRRWPS